jgi:hypothetical protein
MIARPPLRRRRPPGTFLNEIQKLHPPGTFLNEIQKLRQINLRTGVLHAASEL